MGEYKRFTSEETAAVWEGWRRGQSLTAIAGALNRRACSVLVVIRREGGFAPRRRCRSERCLRMSEREDISRGLAAGRSVRAIAKALGRAPSTVSREIKRNGGRDQYRANQADEHAWGRARRPQRCLLAQKPLLRRWIERKLRCDWSPRQISVGLRRAFPDDERMRASHETIYRTLFVQTRGALKQELVSHLRRAKFRHPRPAVPAHQPSIVDGISIHQRPAEVEDRAVPGHWEGDLLMGGVSSQIATLVERHSRYVMLVRIDSKETQVVTKALAKTIRQLPTQLRRSLTWDRGSEMKAHRDFTVATDVQVYFCDPHSPWQRGSNENTNGLLRQYFPKGEDLSKFTQADLNRIARRLNERPRETLGWLTPLEKLQATVALTG